MEATEPKTDTKKRIRKPKEEAPKQMKDIRAKQPKRNERRMKPGAKPGVRNILTIDESLLDPEFEYRIVDNNPERVRQLERMDWDIARTDEPIQVGDSVAGKAESRESITTVDLKGGKSGILMCKRKDWLKDDRAAKEQRLRDIERRMQSDYKEKHNPIE